MGLRRVDPLMFGARRASQLMNEKNRANDLTERMRILSELSPALMSVTDGEGRYQWINRAWREKLGYAVEDISTIHYTALIHPDDRSKSVPRREGEDLGSVELRHSRKDGSFIWLDWSIHASEERGENYTVGYDVTVRKQLESSLKMVEQKYSDLVENADDVICTGDLEGRFITMNKSAELISGYSSSEILGAPFSQFVAPEYRPLLNQMTALKLSGRESTVYEIELLTKDGRRIPMELNTRLMHANGKPVGVQGIARDIRVRKKLTDKLKQRNIELEKENATIRSLMNQDSLTKLPNRRSLNDALEKSVSFSKRTKQPLSLVLCDLDHFKDINDNFGHTAGDQVLSAFGGLLGASCRKEYTPARYGGEEFVLLLPNTDLESALVISERVRARTESLRVPSGANVTASFGVTQFKHEDEANVLLSRADAALYLAKEGGRNRVASC